MRVLLVEDDVGLADRVAKALRSENFAVDVASNGEDGAHLGLTERFDVAVLDLGLPKLDGVAVLKAWRADGRGLPVLILTARESWSDKVEGFKAGADDYLTKPFLTEEVITRLRVLLRRQSGHHEAVLAVGPLAYNTVSDRFLLDGEVLSLTAQEHRILAYLVRHTGQTSSRTHISAHVYGRDLDPDSNTIDVLIGRIRRKLAPHDLLKTHRGLGYCLEDRSA